MYTENFNVIGLKSRLRLWSIFLITIFVVSCTPSNKKTPNTSPEASASMPSPTSTTSKSKYLKYEGAWFTVEYPSDFAVEHSLKSSTSDAAYDSVWFTSADGKVRFYVFSPQWNGAPSDIILKSNEELTDESTEVTDSKEIKRWTIKDKEGKHAQSFEQITDKQQNTSHIFGIQYTSETDLKAYRTHYLHFKSSLQQFAD